VENIVCFRITEAAVRFAPSALAPGVPNEDVYLTKKHAVLVDGELITAESLVNGRTINYADVEELEYFHVELPRYGVIYAAGMPCESFVETRPEFPKVLELPDRRSKMKSHLRSAISPWIDMREPIDVIRDRTI
jgi:hypothetical protein